MAMYFLTRLNMRGRFSKHTPLQSRLAVLALSDQAQSIKLYYTTGSYSLNGLMNVSQPILIGNLTDCVIPNERRQYVVNEEALNAFASRINGADDYINLWVHIPTGYLEWTIGNKPFEYMFRKLGMLTMLIKHGNSTLFKPHLLEVCEDNKIIEADSMSKLLSPVPRLYVMLAKHVGKTMRLHF